MRHPDVGASIDALRLRRVAFAFPRFGARSSGCVFRIVRRWLVIYSMVGGRRSRDGGFSFFASGVRELLATYAIVRTGNKQYRVQAGDSIRVESLPAYAGEIVDMDDVLMVSTDGDVRVGAPVVAGARVRAQVTSRGRGRKIRVFKYKPKVR